MRHAAQLCLLAFALLCLPIGYAGASEVRQTDRPIKIGIIETESSSGFRMPPMIRARRGSLESSSRMRDSIRFTWAI